MASDAPSTTNDHRVNARIDDATQERLNELILTTGQSVSHVVREAIAVYHVQMQKQRPLPRRLLAMAGTGRSQDGRSDVSVNYKRLYTEALEEKHALSQPPAKKKKPKR
jgi:predicted DNA-binding protein